MAWTTPFTYTALAVHTAAQLNTYERDNLIALRAGGIEIASQAALDMLYASSATQLARIAPSSGQTIRKNHAGSAIEAFTPVFVLDRDVAEAEVVSTTTETTVYTFSVPGGTLSTLRFLDIAMIGDVLNNGIGSNTVQIRLKYGATTILDTGAISIGNTGATRGYLCFRARISAKNATNAQIAHGVYGFSQGTGAAGTLAQLTGGAGVQYEGTGTAAEDSTAAKNLVLTIQNGLSSANLSSFCRVVQVIGG